MAEMEESWPVVIGGASPEVRAVRGPIGMLLTPFELQVGNISLSFLQLHCSKGFFASWPHLRCSNGTFLTGQESTTFLDRCNRETKRAAKAV